MRCLQLQSKLCQTLWTYSRKNFKLLFCAGIDLAVGVRIYIFRPMRMTDAILPGSPLRGNIKGCANPFSPSSGFPTGQQLDKPVNMTEHILFSSLPSSRKDQSTGESTFTLLHWLFFTDSLSHISSSPISTMKTAHPFYGPLVSGKSFFHHLSFLLNQGIIGEANWIFSTPVLTSAFKFLSRWQHLNSCLDSSSLIPVLTTAS